MPTVAGACWLPCPAGNRERGSALAAWRFRSLRLAFSAGVPLALAQRGISGVRRALRIGVLARLLAPSSFDVVLLVIFLS
jgi:hypothetical protein